MRFVTTALTLATLARGSVTPTSPGGGKDVYVAGQECSFQWKVDETGDWKSFDVDLYTGHNFAIQNLTRVATGVDGTDPLSTKYSFQCPQVDPPAPIYFYQFSLDGEEPAWTQRFAIAAKNGSVVAAPNAEQLNGDAIPWGIGHLVNDSVPVANAIESVTSPDSRESIASVAGKLFGQDDKDVLFRGSASVIDSTETAAATETVSPTTWIQTASPIPETTHWSSTPTTTTPEWVQPQATVAVTPDTTNATGITGFQQGRVCSRNAQCPEDTPCCSEYGFCGTGRNCLAGCNPLASFEPEACAPVPACISRDYSFQPDSADRFLRNSSTWNGDATVLDWIVDGSTNVSTLDLVTTDLNTGASALTLSLDDHGSNGTNVTSTHSLLYGNVTARIRSGSAAGLVTAFSLISATGDEITFNLANNVNGTVRTVISAGPELDMAEGEPAANTSVGLDDFHDFTMSWMPETITLVVDGTVVQNVTKESTLNDAANRYPQTPSRIRFSIHTETSLDSASESSAFQLAGGALKNAPPTAESVLERRTSLISAVNVLCYPVSLLSNFTFDNTSHTFRTDSSSNVTVVPNLDNASDSSALLHSILPFILPTSSRTVEQGGVVPASSGLPLGGAIASPTGTPSAWTPPAATSLPAEGSVYAAAPAESVPVWNVPALRRIRRLIAFDRVKRDDEALSAYSYGPIDENGQVVVNGYSGSTLIASDYATGMNMLAVASPSEQDGTLPGHPSHPPPAGEKAMGDLAKSSEGKSRVQKWNDLPLWAHILIIGGAALVGLLLVVVVGRCFWRRASSSSGTTQQQAYKPIGDQGDFHDSRSTAAITPYDLGNGMGYDPGVGYSTTTRSNGSVSSTTYPNGGYVPSSSLRKQYFPNRSSTEDRV